MRCAHPEPTWPESWELSFPEPFDAVLIDVVPRTVVEAFAGVTQKLPMALRRRACVHLAALLRRPSAA
jgi:hypothetical protein